ncbi:MAG TPA: hypothetical protein VGP16_14280 [Asanoa sp.]|nr:hypothetical protein [Asanoa sp.]
MTPERAEELLSRRYRWLLHTYPAGYRDSRGEEIVGLLLDAARPGRRWPTPAEAADLLFGGLRRRMGWFPFVAVSAGLSGAGVVAFALAAGLSLFWLTGYELAGEPNWIQEGVSHLGPFETAAPIMYAAWIVTAAVVCLVGRYARLLILLSVSLVAAMPYLADLFGLPQPPGDFLLLSNLLYLEPPTLDFDTLLIVLGLVALAMPARPAPRTRRAIAAAVVAIAAAGWAGGWLATQSADYAYVRHGAFAGAGVAAVAAILVCVGLTIERAQRSSWRQSVVALSFMMLPLVLPALWIRNIFV